MAQYATNASRFLSANNKMNDSSLESCIDSLEEHKKYVDAQKFGRNKKAVAEALNIMKEKQRQVVSFKRDVDRVQRNHAKNEIDKKRLLAAYDLLQEAIKKKIECLARMQEICGIEDYITIMGAHVDTAATQMVNLNLASKPLQPAEGEHVAGFLSAAAHDCIFAARDNWKWICKLADCARVHTHNASQYQQFFHELEEGGQWMVQDLNRLQNSIEAWPTSGTANDAQRLVRELEHLSTALRQWEVKVDQAWETANGIIPVHLRTRETRDPLPCRILASYETNNITLKEGEDVLLIENKDANEWKVKNSKGQETYVPATIVLIPGPCQEAVDAAIQMRLQLLAAWTGTLKSVGRRLINFMLLVFKPEYKDEEIKTIKNIGNKERDDVLRRMDFIEDTLKTHWSEYPSFQELQERMLALQLILEEIQGNPDKASDPRVQNLVSQVDGLEKLMKKYRDLWRIWELYKVSLEASQSPELMLIVDKWEQLKYVSRSYFTKYWKTQLPFDENEKMRKERTQLVDLNDLNNKPIKSMKVDEPALHTSVISETHGLPPEDEMRDLDGGMYETVTVTERKDLLRTAQPTNGQMLASAETVSEMFEEGFAEEVEGAVHSSRLSSRTEDDRFGLATETRTAATEMLDSTEVEEKKTFVIKSVVHPYDQTEISLNEAIMLGFINPNEGIYENPRQKLKIPIPMAMSQGLIKVEFTSTRRGQEKRSTIGIITVKTIREAARPFTILKVKDTRANKWITAKDAINQGVVDDQHGMFIDRRAREEYPVYEAIQKGLVEVQYDTGEAPPPEVVKESYAVRGVVDKTTKRVLNFTDAVRRGLIDREGGRYKDTTTGEWMYVGDAIMRGYLKARPLDEDETRRLDVDPRNRLVIDKTEKIRRRVLQPLAVIGAFRRAAEAVKK